MLGHQIGRSSLSRLRPHLFGAFTLALGQRFESKEGFELEQSLRRDLPLRQE